MCACSVHDNRPVAYWLFKLKMTNSNKQSEMRNSLHCYDPPQILHLLLGAEFYIHTYYLKIITNETTPDCVACRLNYIDQFKSCICFIPDKNNVKSNALSWLDILVDSEQTFNYSVSKEWIFLMFYSNMSVFYSPPPLSVSDYNPMDYFVFSKQSETDKLLHCIGPQQGRNYLKCLITWWHRYTVGICPDQFHDLASFTLVYGMLRHSGSRCMYVSVSNHYHYPSLCADNVKQLFDLEVSGDTM